MRLRRLTALLVPALLLVSTVQMARGEDAAAPAEPQYLMFQIFTAGPGFTTESGKQVISKLPPSGFLDGEARQIVEAIGVHGDGRHRLGVVVGPLALDYTDAQLRTLVERTFALAAKYNIAVGLHIDDSKFWMNRRDLWGNPANVEWLDWKGTPNTGQYLNWGQPWKAAPQACFNSPQMLKEARRVAGDVIGPAIAEQLQKLRATGQEALFAGVIVGWETAIGRDFQTHQDLGYCALTNLGFSEKSPPPDPDSALELVIRSWIGTWARSLAGAGVPRDRIYSHIAFISRQQFQKQGSAGRTYSQTVLHTPPTVAFGEDYRPGFSTYVDAATLGDIYAALEAHGNPPCAFAEGANIDIQPGYARVPRQSMETYLAHRFNHGATITNLFGWDIGDHDNPFRRAAESGEAIAAYRKFLSGVRLEEGASPQATPGDMSALERRVRALPERLAKFHEAGGDVVRIQPDVKELDGYVKEGRLDEIRKELDFIEAAIDAKLGPELDPP